MARLRLTTTARHTFPYLYRSSPVGPAIHIPGYRLYIALYLAPPDAGELRTRPSELDFARIVDAVVDTGCMLSILPFGMWRPFESEIRWLDRPATITPADRSIRVAGGCSSTDSVRSGSPRPTRTGGGCRQVGRSCSAWKTQRANRHHSSGCGRRCSPSASSATAET